MNPNLNTALCDLCDAIRSVTLGSVEKSVMSESGKALILNWNDHNSDDKIDESLELAEWEYDLCDATRSVTLGSDEIEAMN